MSQACTPILVDGASLVSEILVPSKTAKFPFLTMDYGGLITRRHNDIRDLSVSLLKDVRSNVCKEPTLQPLTGELLRLCSASTDDGARLDISAEGFWGHWYQHVFFDVRVFCPLSATNRSRSLVACYRANEEIKKRKYDQHIREVEHASFSSLIFFYFWRFWPYFIVVYQKIVSSAC